MRIPKLVFFPCAVVGYLVGLAIFAVIEGFKGGREDAKLIVK